MQVSSAAQTVRAVAMEMERIGMHLATLTGLATDIAFLAAVGVGAIAFAPEGPSMGCSAASYIIGSWAAVAAARSSFGSGK